MFTEFRVASELGVKGERGAGQLEILTRFSAGTEILREGLRVRGRWRPADGHARLDADMELEGRQFQSDSDFALNSDTVEGTLRVHGRRRVSETLELGLRGRGEVLRYDQRSRYEYDSQRGDLWLTAALQRGWTLLVDLEAGGGWREVPDSTGISYQRAHGLANLAWYPRQTLRLGLLASAERRDYRDDALRSSSWDLVLEPELGWRGGSGWRVRAQMPQEWLLYDRDSEVYYDAWIGRAGLFVGHRRGELELGVEPRWSWMSSPGTAEDEYRQPSVLVRFDWWGGGRFWLSLSEEIGRRDYGGSGGDLELYSDYTFLRTTLMASWSLSEQLSLDGYLSDEPESHGREEDDSRLTLLAASLRWRF